MQPLVMCEVRDTGLGEQSQSVQRSCAHDSTAPRVVPWPNVQRAVQRKLRREIVHAYGEHEIALP
jgi:hypothetical protein